LAGAPVVVIGAGLTGLTIARALQRAGRRVRVLEQAGRAGGVIRSHRREGFLAEDSANSMLVKAQEVEDFVRDLGLGDRLVQANPVANKRYLVRNGKVLALPMSPLQGLATPVYSPGAKLRLLREPFVAAAPADADESVARFVTRRLGREFLDYGIAALVSGIFAGDPEKLSLRHAFPKVWQLEQRYGSLVGGAIRLARERRKAGAPAYKSRIMSFSDGLETLPATLAASMGDRLHFGAVTRSIVREASGWRIEWSDGRGEHTAEASALVCTVPLPHLGSLPWPAPLQEDCARLPRPVHPPVTTLNLGYRREQVAHPLDGFGLLAPLVERRAVLGVIFSSTLFPERAPDGHVLLIAFMGGATRPELAAASEVAALEIARPELAALLGVRGEPVFASHRHWPRAIPQYDVGHGDLLAGLEALEGRWPGLHFAGNFRGGPGVNDCIASGLALARRLATAG
jgi:protoporphyrinogen/coproporphyrinogen III oxidase